MDHVGTAIKELRRAAGLSRVDLAAAAGISVVFLIKIEQGSRQPSPQKLAQIAKTLGVTSTELAARAELLSASSASTREEMSRFLLRAAAIGGAAAAAVANPFLAPAGYVRALLGRPATITVFGILLRAVQEAQRKRQIEGAKDDIDPSEMRTELIAQIQSMSDEQLIDVANLLRDFDPDAPSTTSSLRL